MKSDKNRAQIDFIKNLLNQNEKRATILDKFGQKWEKVSRTTFGRRMESAKAEVLEENKKKEEIRDSLLPEQVKAELEANTASETELDVVMSKIALAGIKVEEFIKGKPVVREVNPMEMIAAAEKLYKRKGSYAPEKQAKTNTNGEDVDDRANIIVLDAKLLTDEQLDKILEANKGKE